MFNTRVTLYFNTGATPHLTGGQSYSVSDSPNESWSYAAATDTWALTATMPWEEWWHPVYASDASWGLVLSGGFWDTGIIGKLLRAR